MKRVAAVGVLLAFVGLGAQLASVGIGAQVAAAHPTNRFRACTKDNGGGCVEVGAQIPFGGTVVLKGRVRPLHAGLMADVLRRNPHGHVWRVVGQVRVSDAGTLRYRWLTTLDDVTEGAPYLFKFRLRGHGRSNATEAYVFLHPTPSPAPAAG